MMPEEIKDSLLKAARRHIRETVHYDYWDICVNTMEFPGIDSEYLMDSDGKKHLATDCFINDFRSRPDDSEVTLTCYDSCTKEDFTVSLNEIGYNDTMEILKFLI